MNYSSKQRILPQISEYCLKSGQVTWKDRCLYSTKARELPNPCHLAWSVNRVAELRLKFDMSEAKGRKPGGEVYFLSITLSPRGIKYSFGKELAGIGDHYPTPSLRSEVQGLAGIHQET